MNLRELSPFPSRAISQYAPPMNYELAGKTFTLLMDDGYDCILHFIDETSLEWNLADGVSAREEYICMKADETTYLVSFECAGTALRTSLAFVIDLENYLVTRQTAVIGENPKWPYLMNTRFEFGAIDRPGYEYKVYPRHGYTSDLVGTCVQWAYGTDMITVHVYYCSNFYRITYPLDLSVTAVNPDDPAARSNQALSEMLKSLPSRDEATTYIKIKEGVYFVSLSEQNAEKLLGDKIMFRSNNLVFLQNYRRVYQVGRAFGTRTMPGGDEKRFLAFGAYGKLLDPKHPALHELLNAPNPFLV